MTKRLREEEPAFPFFSWSNVYAVKIKSLNLCSKILIYAVLSRGKFCREFTHFFGVLFLGKKIRWRTKNDYYQVWVWCALFQNVSELALTCESLSKSQPGRPLLRIISLEVGPTLWLPPTHSPVLAALCNSDSWLASGKNNWNFGPFNTLINSQS